MRNELTHDTYSEAKHIFGATPHDRVANSWYHFKTHNFTIMAPPKAGQSTIRQFIWINEMDDQVIAAKQHQAVGDVYVIVRDPVSRFCSLWRSKCRDKGGILDKRIYGMTPVELMNHLESGARDIHWTPQYELLGKLEPTLIPLKMLGWWWKQSGLGSLGKYNATVGDVEIDDSLRKRILTFYADDVILHNKAECDFCWGTLHKLNS